MQHQHPVSTTDQALTFYTVDLSQEGYPVYHLAPGTMTTGIFSGPFDDPGEASQEFQAYWGAKEPVAYLDAAAFQAKCHETGMAHHVSYFILCVFPGGGATYLSEETTGKTRDFLTPEAAIVEVLALKPHAPRHAYEVLEETVIGRTRATRLVCSFPTSEEEPVIHEREYLAEVLRTCTLGSEDLRERVCLCALGLTGEAGEVADLVKKHCYQGHRLDRLKLCEELGDVLWYMMLLSHSLDMSLAEVMRGNIQKLRRRYPRGFEATRSRERGGEA